MRLVETMPNSALQVASEWLVFCLFARVTLALRHAHGYLWSVRLEASGRAA